jgi:hypothetical protein
MAAALIAAIALRLDALAAGALPEGQAVRASGGDSADTAGMSGCAGTGDISSGVGLSPGVFVGGYDRRPNRTNKAH